MSIALQAVMNYLGTEVDPRFNWCFFFKSQIWQYGPLFSFSHADSKVVGSIYFPSDL